MVKRIQQNYDPLNLEYVQMKIILMKTDHNNSKSKLGSKLRFGPNIRT